MQVYLIDRRHPLVGTPIAAGLAMVIGPASRSGYRVAAPWSALVAIKISAGSSCASRYPSILPRSTSGVAAEVDGLGQINHDPRPRAVGFFGCHRPRIRHPRALIDNHRIACPSPTASTAIPTSLPPNGSAPRAASPSCRCSAIPSRTLSSCTFQDGS